MQIMQIMSFVYLSPKRSCRSLTDWCVRAEIFRPPRQTLPMCTCVICAGENAMRTCFVYTTQSHFIFKVSATRYFFAQNEMELHSVGVFLL